MEARVKAGHTGPKGHPTGDVMDIGAAAGCDAVALLSAILLIAVKKALHKGRVLRNIVGRIDMPL
jgi:hypothetical protein